MAGLDSLLENREEADLELVGEVLGKLIRIDSDSGDLRPLERFDELNGESKVAALVLGYRAAVALGRKEANGFRVNEVVSWSGMPRGTVGRELSEFTKKQLLVRKGSGIYDVPGHAVRKLVSIVKEGLRGD